jgi:hypothetical protein
MTKLGALGAGLGLLAAGLTAGCRIVDHKDGDKENVRIATPFGGMSVKTNESAVQNGLGLEVYPGAKPEDKKDDDSSAADINFSLGGFHLGVKAASYTTPDSPEKVLAFYRPKMAKYGTVIQCLHHQPVGTPTRTQEGLTCSDDSKTDEDHRGFHLNVSADKDKGELKAGSKLHQHIVSVETKGDLTKIGMVMLDLPGKLNQGDDDEKQ